jgi:fluoroacetyl-CoA thioesterase
MNPIPVGSRGEKIVVVDDKLAIRFLGLEGARVLATPWMIALMETVCRDSIFALLETGYDSVGTEVNVKHLAAAPLGAEVRFRSEVIGVQERRVTFRVEAESAGKMIGEGTHERAIINVARFAERLAGNQPT